MKNVESSSLSKMEGDCNSGNQSVLNSKLWGVDLNVLKYIVK